MSLVLSTVAQDIFTIDGVFSLEECASLIGRAESIGFEAASVRTASGPKMMTTIRNNDRVALVDESLADELWQRVRFLVPILDNAVACGVDRELRFYRYFPGQQFRRHKDGAATDQNGRISKLSYLIYLNDDCVGGDTVFSEFREINGVREQMQVAVHPSAGMALLFRHEKWHEGTPVSAGRKYVLRSDVFYQTPIASSELK